MNNEIEKKILNELIDKYEKSKSFTNKNKVTQNFVVKIEKIFPKYNDHAYYDAFVEINDSIKALVRKSLVIAKEKSFNVFNEVKLNVDSIEEAYSYIKRKQKKETNIEILELLEKYKDKNEILNNYCLKQIENISLNKNVQYFNDLNELENILISIENILNVKEETYVRDFSVKFLKDSKTFESISNKVINLLFEYGEYPDKDNILESLNIVKNPTYVNFKGSGILKIKDNVIDLSKLNGDIALSSKLIKDIESIKVTGNKVMTIENLTSFNTELTEGIFYIYLGGFHNQVREEFIKKIGEQNKDIEFYHFGDIDAGGFYIFENLINKTGIDFKPFNMDVGTLKKYNNYTKRLTDNDKERLKKLTSKHFEEVIQYMLENNCKLEQEAVGL